MTPIEKNVIVVDEQGNKYEATYPKRAKGLVKNGRARFIDENTICLACPPKNNNLNNLEDIKMSENNNIISENNSATVGNNGFTKEAIFEQIKKIHEQLSQPLDSIHRFGEALTDALGEHEYQDDETRNQAISEIQTIFLLREQNIAERENSLRQLLSYYMKMYDDALAQEQAEKLTRREKIANEMLKILNDPNQEVLAKQQAKELLSIYLTFDSDT